jgi:hypothetical protein
MTAPGTSREDSLRLLLRALKLPGFVDHYAALAVQADKDGTSYVTVQPTPS